MADSWMYDAFPLKRADGTTRGDDYQYVIQSLDAALRHTFGFPVGVSITPPFSISESGDVEILQTLSIGSAVPIDEIVGAITTSAEDEDDSRLASVTALRAFTAEYIDNYLTSEELFVLRAGDSMTGALVADGGITASSELAISKAVFATDPMLGAGIALQSYGGVDLIQFNSAVVVGDLTEPLSMTGSGGRPLYKGENVALVSDIVGSIPGMDYVPDAGGTFDGLVTFDGGILISYGNSITMEWNTGASNFVVAEVGTDAIGDVVFAAGDDTFDFLGDVQAVAFDLDIGTRENVLYFSSGDVKVGDVSVGIDLIGDTARPLYNGAALAMLTDTTGSIQAGSGITFTGADPTDISVTENGITAFHLPASPEEGKYLRLNSTPEVYWSGLDIVAGAGSPDALVVSENGTTKQITIDINNLGVDTAQLAVDAVTQIKIADDAIGYKEFDADRGTPDTSDGLYLLTVDTVDGVGTLEWQKGGAAGVLGTIEVIAEYDENSTTDYEEVVSLANGPYVITKVWYTILASPQTGMVEVVIDGQPAVLEVTLDDGGANGNILIGNTEDAVYDFPFFAKTSVVIRHKRVGGTGTIRCDVEAMRMA